MIHIRSTIGYVAGFNATTRVLTFSERAHALVFAAAKDVREFMGDVQAFGQGHQLLGCAAVQA